MRSYLLFLLWCLVEVHSQTFPYVSFNSQTLANHSYVDLGQVGSDDASGSDSVQCHTDLTTCCRNTEGSHRGDWYFPAGTRLYHSLEVVISLRVVELRELITSKKQC